MLRVLFWNINRKDLRKLVCDAAVATSADVVILIENGMTTFDTLRDLKTHVSPRFDIPLCAVSRFQLFSRNVSLNLRELYGGDRISIRQLNYEGTELLLGMIHLVDKKNWDSVNQAGQVQLLAGEIRRQELAAGHDRSVLMGDFNMNPFDPAMNMALGMNAMMTTKCVERGTRIVQRQEYPFFYNPMWGLLGDRTPGPAGTYYHSASSQGNYGWNMLDQVLVRPAALQWFGDVKILTSAGATSLQTKSLRPDKESASDHFPILLTLK